MAREIRYHSSITDLCMELHPEMLRNEVQKHAYESGLRAGDIIKGEDGGNYHIELRTEMRKNNHTDSFDMVTTGTITEIEEVQYTPPRVHVDCMPHDPHTLLEVAQALQAGINPPSDQDVEDLPIDEDEEDLPELSLLDQMKKDNEAWLEGSTMDFLRDETDEWLEGAME